MIFEIAARAHIASRGSSETRSIYRADLTRWLTFCELEKADVDAPSFDVAIKFRDALVSKYAPQTVRRVLSAISAMYDTSGLVNHFKSSKRLPRPEYDEISSTREFSDEEVTALLGAAKAESEKNVVGLRDYVVMQLLYDTGMRITEVVAMRRDQLGRSAGQLTLVAKVKKKGRVETAIPPQSARLLERWLSAEHHPRHVFPASRGKGPLTRRTISRRLLIYGERVGVKDVHPHRFRATYATTALTAGIPLHEVQASMHHSDPKTTLRYDRGVRGMGVAAAVAAFRGKVGST